MTFLYIRWWHMFIHSILVCIPAGTLKIHCCQLLLTRWLRWNHFPYEHIFRFATSGLGSLFSSLRSRGIAFSFKPPAKTNLIWVDTNWDWCHLTVSHFTSLHLTRSYSLALTWMTSKFHMTEMSTHGSGRALPRAAEGSCLEFRNGCLES